MSRLNELDYLNGRVVIYCMYNVTRSIWMLAQKLTRLQPSISSSLRCRKSYHVPPRLHYLPSPRSFAMAQHPVSSSSHPAQIPALESPHAETEKTQKQNKERKSKVVTDGSAYPLEVRVARTPPPNYRRRILSFSCNPDHRSSITVSRFSRN